MGKTEKNRKENHATKVTKIPKTKRQKYGMNKTIGSFSYVKNKVLEKVYIKANKSNKVTSRSIS